MTLTQVAVFDCRVAVSDCRKISFWEDIFLQVAESLQIENGFFLLIVSLSALKFFL